MWQLDRQIFMVHGTKPAFCDETKERWNFATDCKNLYMFIGSHVDDRFGSADAHYIHKWICSWSAFIIDQNAIPIDVLIITCRARQRAEARSVRVNFKFCTLQIIQCNGTYNILMRSVFVEIKLSRKFEWRHTNHIRVQMYTFILINPGNNLSFNHKTCFIDYDSTLDH